jgi:putative transcriptional regulator
MIGDNIKLHRTNKGMTQEELAAELNVVRQTVAKWEKNLSVPDADMLVNLSEALDVSINTLLGNNTPDPKTSDISSQLEELNALVATRIQQHNKIMTVIKITIPIILLLMFLVAIYPRWNEMWYDFGQNLYHAFHS